MLSINILPSCGSREEPFDGGVAKPSGTSESLSSLADCGAAGGVATGAGAAAGNACRSRLTAGAAGPEAAAAAGRFTTRREAVRALASRRHNRETSAAKCTLDVTGNRS
jgi:hypothetical protein